MSEFPVPNDWPCYAAAYDLKERLKNGSGNKVVSQSKSFSHRAYCPTMRKCCAIKRIHLEKLRSRVRNLPKVVEALMGCSHANIVKYYTCFVENGMYWMVMEFMDIGSLTDLIRSRSRAHRTYYGVLDEESIATIIKCVLLGLKYLHEIGYVHRDIKCANILLAKDGAVKIGDLSLCLPISGDCIKDSWKSQRSFVGTTPYIAPEILSNVGAYDSKVDMWSLGIILIELATGNTPSYKLTKEQTIVATMTKNAPTLDTLCKVKNQYKAYGNDFRDVIALCLNKNPSHRSSARKLLHHPFFLKANCNQFLVETIVPYRTSIRSKAPTSTSEEESSEEESSEDESSEESEVEEANPGWPWSSCAIL